MTPNLAGVQRGEKIVENNQEEVIAEINAPDMLHGEGIKIERRKHNGKNTRGGPAHDMGPTHNQKASRFSALYSSD